MPKLPSNCASIQSKIERISISSLRAPARHTRIHSKAKIRTLASMLASAGQIDPIIINAANVIVHGTARVAAARELGWREIDAIRVAHLTDAQLRAYALAANKMVLRADFDLGEVRLELEEIEAGVDLSMTGFTIPEIDTIRGAYSANAHNDLVDDVPAIPASTSAVSQLGDLFRLGRHLLACGDALDPAVLARVMGDAQARMIFTDPPYNVPISGHVSTRRSKRHREFAQASGELDEDQFESFLERALSTSANHLVDGGLAFVCMDHAHIGELIAAGSQVFAERKSICVWDKGAGSMGSFYRNAHELVAVFKKGTARHINNVELGKHGRNRTTIWRYPGIAQLGKGRAKALSLHPTVKPVALVADAILDAAGPGDIVLDPFGGSGTTLIAAQLKDRSARLVELDPFYVDTIVQRFEALTGEKACLADRDICFAELREKRAGVPEQPHPPGDGA